LADQHDQHRRVAAVIPPQPDELHRIGVPWDPARASGNRRFAHWSGRHKEERGGDSSGQQLGLLYWRIDAFTTEERVLVQYWVLRGRRLDDVNAFAGIKPLEDGIFRSSWNNGEGVTKDDAEIFCQVEFVRQLIAPEWAHNEWTVVVCRRHPDQTGADRRAAFKALRRRSR
jgi:hypothetical protein